MRVARAGPALPSALTRKARALLAAQDEARSRQQAMLYEARARGELRPIDSIVTEVAGRAMAYGRARMFLDGHLPREGAMELTAAVLDVRGGGSRRRRPTRLLRPDPGWAQRAEATRPGLRRPDPGCAGQG
ncbi:uncharacterized protein SOCE836_011990 [Sorangium cellulosum]|uniref:Uncharacterized protein n=1 Tax=Sorangium cellulosum TaxID=56 RepID=A0A4V0NFB7_SORCE|nr:uncharacterized protein SOCE836_011990 [Sorangium cellulosum]WCQ88503.1 hypothetical protein NQZ70_01181 [Sorangium sp. Soce836]